MLETKMNYQAILFDLDGTLVDSAPDIAEAVNRTLAQYGYAQQPFSVIANWIGDGARELLNTALHHAQAKESFDDVFPHFMQNYADTVLLTADIYPHVKDTLARLHRSGVKMAVCSNKPERFINPVLSKNAIAGYFDVLVGGDTLKEKKPSALPLMVAAEQLGVSIEQCLMVGDSATDFNAAQAAGMDCVLVSYGYARGIDVHALNQQQVIDDFSHLLQYIESDQSFGE